MSKRKNKNKFRFRPHVSPLVGATDQQPQLPLADSGATVSDPIPAEITEHAISLAPQVESELPPVCVEAEPQIQASAIALDASLGQRLRAAREARGLSCEAVSQALKLPVTVVKALEAEQFERIGHGVFLRGYLCKYLQLLDLPQLLADRIVRDHAELPPLTTNGTISHPRYLFERYSGSALYLILTGVIVVPAVLLAVRAGFDQNLSRITSLDAPPAAIAVPASDQASPAAFAATEAAHSPQKPASVPAAAKPEEAPLVASMTPFPAAAENKPATVPAPVARPANRLHLSLTQASWVEIVDADGRKLEYGLLPAGSERDYASERALDIRIGNAEGANLSIDGKRQDLASFRHANVAHLKIAGGAATAYGGG
jgi:cytoskeleton protein RodZ